MAANFLFHSCARALACSAGALALLPRFEAHEHHRRVGEVQRVEDVQAGEAQRRADALGVAHDVFHLLEDFVGALERRALGQLDGDEEIALVLVRNEPAGHELAEQPDADHHRHQQQHGERGLAGQAADDAAVAVAQPVEDAVEQLEELRDRAAARRRFLEQQRATSAGLSVSALITEKTTATAMVSANWL